MDRRTLRQRHKAAIAGALGIGLGIGFALGYTLRNPEVTGTFVSQREVRDFERDFPGARRAYKELRDLFAKGAEVREDYDALLDEVEKALADHSGYVPLVALQAAIWEDWTWNLKLGRFKQAGVQRLAKRVGLPADASPDAVAEGCRARALKAWLSVESSPLVAEEEKYGERWRVLWEQHTNALRQAQTIRTPIDENGMADLARAFNAFALTRDFVRYPNNLSDERAGYSFEEKHIQNVIHCAQHADVVFQLPCLPHLSPLRGGTIRRDLEIFRSGLRINGQKLDVESRAAGEMHLLAFNTTLDRRIVKAQTRILYTDGTEVVGAFSVPPWRQTAAMQRDALARRALDPVHRDSEIHLANGSELNVPTSYFYMYHVAVKLDPQKSLDEIYFPRHDPTSVGLEDPGVDDVCIVAMTLK